MNQKKSKFLPANLAIAVGTYDGVIAGWELSSFNKNDKNNKKKQFFGRRRNKKDDDSSKVLKLVFATAVHSGSIRSMSITKAPMPNNDNDTCTTALERPGSLLSCGYDETLRIHDWHKRLTSSGEIRTPSDFGTPTCSDYAGTNFCLLGFDGGKIVIYKKRDWSIQHVLAGHHSDNKGNDNGQASSGNGVASLAVHPSGKLALSGGQSDGKLKLWDLTKGRLAFVNNIGAAKKMKSSNKKRGGGGGGGTAEPINCIVWQDQYYGFCHGSHVTVRDIDNGGKDVLDVELPSRINQMTLLSGSQGLFVAAACNDGSLPVLEVNTSTGISRRAIMAIEPVDSVVVREERFKCIASLGNYTVVTATSAGVVSIMDLSGAVNMILTGEEEEDGESDEQDDSDKEKEMLGKSNDDDDDENEDDIVEETAVDIVESVQLGTGARITCLVTFKPEQDEMVQVVGQEEEEEKVEENSKVINDDNVELENNNGKKSGKKRKLENSKNNDNNNNVAMSEMDVEKARSLVSQAKELKRKKETKKSKKKRKK